MRFFLLLLIFMTAKAFAQSSMDLGDVQINGELMNDNRLRINSRGAAAIDDRVKYRIDYRKEILESYNSAVDAGPADSTADQKP
jgi:hypothetical protein